VNFLLHRHLAARELVSGAAGIGAMLPDLWRMADRRVRARKSVTFLDSRLDDLQRGVAHHLEADRWFHRCEPFEAGEAATRRAFAPISAPKLALFAHAAWEMCLDGALLLRDGAAETQALRRHLAATDENAARELGDLHGADRLAPDDRERFHETVCALRAGIARGPWIEGYKTGSGLAARLERVRMRVGLGPLGDAERSALGAALGARLEAARPALDELFLLRAREAA
jgi:hypothetical protein